MSYTTKVISIGSLNVEDGSGYKATFEHSFVQPETSINRVQRDADSPLVTAVAPGLHTYLLGVVVVEEGLSADDLDAKRRALMRALDSSRGPITVTIENETGTARQRYMRCVVRKTDQVGNQFGRGFMAALEAADDVRWRSTVTEEEVWEFTEVGSQTITNVGDLEAFPTIIIKPTTVKSEPNWVYRRPVIVRWKSPYGGDHPIDITGGGLNTAALVSAGKVTDSTNLGVYLNGRYVPFWYGAADGQPGGFNSTSTKMWINLWASPAVEILTAEYITEAATTWRVRNDSGLAAAGILDIEGEIISYASRSAGYLYGVQRGLYGTTADYHIANTPAEIIPAVGYIFYGPEGAVPDSQKDSRYRNAVEPLVTAGSSNGAWTYTAFREHYRSVRWSFSSHLNNLSFVKESAGNGWFDADQSEPWTAMGLEVGWTSASYFGINFAVPVSQIAISGRHMARGSPTQYPGSPKLITADRNGAQEYTVWNANAGVSQTVNAAFSVTQTLPAGVRYTHFRWGVQQANFVQADIQTMTVTFDADYLPQIEVGAEDTEYDLDMQIANQTTGEYFNVELPNMTPGEGLVIDSETQTVVYEADGSNQYAAVQMYPIRPRFLRLVPGPNVINVFEDGMGTVEVTVRYEPRWYT